MIRTPVTSSNIISIGWSDGTLEIEFKAGTVYQYANVPQHTLDELLASNSKGQFFAQHIRDYFIATKVSAANPEPVVVEAVRAETGEVILLTDVVYDDVVAQLVGDPLQPDQESV